MSRRTLRRRWRRRSRLGGGLGRRHLFVAVLAAVAVWGAGRTHVVPPATALIHAPAAAAPAPAAPAGGPYTPASWAVALLAAGGWPRSRCNLAAIQAWENAEGGNWANAATYNPLNTTKTEPGSTPINSVPGTAGVQAFTSWQSGLTATLTVLHNGLYQPILAALGAGNNAQAVADAVGGSPWGTKPFTATC